MMKYAAAAAASMLIAGTASAAIVVDGTLDADYGTRTATVTYDANAPESNFGGAAGAPTNQTRASSYNIYLRADSNYVYGFFEALGDQPIVTTGANLYFNIDGISGSDIGFELSPATANSAGNANLFVPGRPGSQVRSDLLRVAGNNGLNLEVAIPVSYFNAAVDGANYYPGQTFPGGRIVLNLSQTFGYSVAGGQSFYGNDRLGAVNVPAAAEAGVPEPAAWLTMIGGFALLGAAARRRRAAVRFA